LISSSQFFKNATKPGWRADPSKPIDLFPVDEELFTVDIEYFKDYVKWLYTRQLPLSCKDTFVILAKLYILSEDIQDKISQKAIIDAMMWAGESIYPSLEAFGILYGGIPDT
jgi:hypothetical protein